MCVNRFNEKTKSMLLLEGINKFASICMTALAEASRDCIWRALARCVLKYIVFDSSVHQMIDWELLFVFVSNRLCCVLHVLHDWCWCIRWIHVGVALCKRRVFILLFLLICFTFKFSTSSNINKHHHPYNSSLACTYGHCVCSRALIYWLGYGQTIWFCLQYIKPK